ncbi:FAD/NAD(P)-binding domain-containing protein [Mycena vitilis]|nr:FAD/NAD(P)-binding domain-containing protein [Mycena vitilis]
MSGYAAGDPDALIYETSQTNVEIGAGIGAQANALRILQQWGVSRENLRPVDFDGVISFDSKTGLGTECPWLISRTDETHDIVCHRIDLHDELKRLALGEGEGPPAQLILGSKVVGSGFRNGKGEIIHADLVIGADGIHYKSVVRTSILGYVINAVASGWLKEFPELGWLTEGLSGGRTVISKEAAFRIFFIYRCRSGTLVNFGGLFTDSEQNAPDLEPTTPFLKWQLKTVPALLAWIRGCAALLGDAAHGPLPTLGQGAAMAIEEAATLGCLFPLGTTREDVPARLDAYQILRKARGEYVNTQSLAQAGVPEKRGTYARSRERQTVIIEHDTVKVAQEYYDAHFGSGIKV